MYLVKLPKSTISPLVRESVLVNIRGKVLYSKLTKKTADSESNSMGTKIMTPHYEIAISDCYIEKNDRAMKNLAYKSITDYIEKRFLRQSVKHSQTYFSAVRFSDYDVYAQNEDIHFNSDNPLKNEIAKGVDVTLKLVFYKDENGVVQYSFHGINVNSPLALYDARLHKVVNYQKSEMIER